MFDLFVFTNYGCQHLQTHILIYIIVYQSNPSVYKSVELVQT